MRGPGEAHLFNSVPDVHSSPEFTPSPAVAAVASSTTYSNRLVQSIVYKNFDHVELDDGRRVSILRSLGRGDVGHVYLGALGLSYVVVKVIRRRLATGQAAIEEAINKEVQILRNLEHPHIMHYIHHGRRPPMGHEGNEPFIVLEYCGERNFRDTFHLYRSGLVPINETLKIAHSIADALVYLHDKGIGHFDVKPDNIMIDSNGKAALGDFGQARHMDDADFGTFRGAIAYAPPESVTKGERSLKNDVWGLGVTLYEVVCGGILPFAGNSQQSMKELIVRAAPPPLPERLRIPPPVVYVKWGSAMSAFSLCMSFALLADIFCAGFRSRHF